MGFGQALRIPDTGTVSAVKFKRDNICLAKYPLKQI